MKTDGIAQTAPSDRESRESILVKVRNVVVDGRRALDHVELEIASVLGKVAEARMKVEEVRRALDQLDAAAGVQQPEAHANG